MSMIQDVMDYIKECDKEVGEALYLEYNRQRRNLELIASENIVSPAVMLAMGTVPTNKYAEGYPAKRYYGGCEDVDILEELAIERLYFRRIRCRFSNRLRQRASSWLMLNGLVI